MNTFSFSVWVALIIVTFMLDERIDDLNARIEALETQVEYHDD